MADAFFLSEYDAELLRGLLEEQRQRVNRRPRQAPPPLGGQAPEVLTVKTPATGIPALVMARGTGTGTNVYDDPGSAECSIYHIDTPYYGTATDELHPVDALVVRVFNLSTSPVPGNKWIKATKDKYGAWIADQSGSGGIGNSGTTPPDCTITHKLWGQVFYEGATLRQHWTIEDCCCRILYEGCSTVPQDFCGTGTGTGHTVGPGGCVCTSPGPSWYVFSLSGVGNSTGVCTACANLNGNYCLDRTDYSGIPTPCSYGTVIFAGSWWLPVHPAFTICPGVSTTTPQPGGPCTNLGASGSAQVSVTLVIYPDGSAGLYMASACVNCAGSWFAFYYIAAWTCDVANTLTLVNQLGNSTCTMPTTITVNPATTAALCCSPPSGGSSGTGCSGCAASTWNVTFSGWNDNTCTGCTGINTTFGLTLTSSCTYESNGFTDPALTCPGPSIGTAHVILFDNLTTGWELWVVTPTGTTKFIMSYSLFSCTLANVNWTQYSVDGGCLFNGVGAFASVIKT